MCTFGENLRCCRLKKKISQRHLAEMVGCSESYISHIEHGLRIPALDMAIRIADVMEVPLEQLVEGSYSQPLVEGFDKLKARISTYPRKHQKQILHLFFCCLDSMEAVGMERLPVSKQKKDFM